LNILGTELIQHGLPPHGLIAIHPVLQTTTDHRWYEDGTTLDWALLSSHHETQRFVLENERNSLSLSQYIDPEAVPPMSFRIFLQQLAVALNTTVLYYAGSTWGGDVESEYVLSYQPEERLLITDIESKASNALRDGLAMIGINIPSGFFALHTREFDWEQHRLPLLAQIML
jgi:hypothetical protein